MFFIVELCQNRQLYPTSKQCFIFLFMSSNICVLSIPIFFFFLHWGEKTQRTPLIRGDHRPPPPQEGVETRQRQQEEGDVVEIVTTTGDRNVVDPGHFTSESAQILIGEIMGCNRDLENIQKYINDVKKK
ncbi:hypothetical protein AB205_0203440 [Aquarana catesbeiana]|uniref:Uncharacterized protein n=1 Tax=Aquarana catesbeiana TaxID=8400 RepID=A0A2G9QB32_AQUCT|nr:hypothetical protein AB205_0203440 [Aquarana catesbeiana]